MLELILFAVLGWGAANLFSGDEPADGDPEEGGPSEPELPVDAGIFKGDAAADPEASPPQSNDPAGAVGTGQSETGTIPGPNEQGGAGTPDEAGETPQMADPDPRQEDETATGQVQGSDGDDTMLLDGDTTGFGGAGDDTFALRDSATAHGGEGDDSFANYDVDGHGRSIEGGETVAHGGAGNDYFRLFKGTGIGSAGDDNFVLPGPTEPAYGQGTEHATADGGDRDGRFFVGEWNVDGAELTGGEGADQFIVEPGAAFNPLNADPDILITDFMRGEDVLVIGNDPEQGHFNGFDIRLSGDGTATEIVLHSNQAAHDDDQPVQRVIRLDGITDFDASDVRFTDTSLDLINAAGAADLPDLALTGLSAA
ncbi:MAG: hypothetical protein GY717_13800 [Rhodobacteraceae bacterium]|nr:hypothetical protein [Paracoccaceae bacterium]